MGLGMIFLPFPLEGSAANPWNQGFIFGELLKCRFETGHKQIAGTEG